MEKTSQLLFVLLALLWSVAPLHAGWFTHDDGQVALLQSQLQHQEACAGGWMMVAFILGIGCIIALLIGAAIGSKGRRHGK